MPSKLVIEHVLSKSDITFPLAATKGPSSMKRHVSHSVVNSLSVLSDDVRKYTLSPFFSRLITELRAYAFHVFLSLEISIEIRSGALNETVALGSSAVKHK